MTGKQSEQKAGCEDPKAHNRCDQSKFPHAINIIRVRKPASIGDRATIPAILNSHIGAKEAHGKVERGFCVSELRGCCAKMARAVCRLRRMEHARRGDSDSKSPQVESGQGCAKRRLVVAGGPRTGRIAAALNPLAG